MPPQTVLLDTSAATTNLGDKIIVESIIREVPELRSMPRIGTHWPPTPTQFRQIRRADRLVFCGTNLLTSNLWRARQWPAVGLFSPWLRDKVVYLGVGWGDPTMGLDAITRRLISRSMAPGVPIGVRDSDTLARTLNAGLSATLIGCPTMWSLPTESPNWEGVHEVVCSITDYRADPELDTKMIRHLQRRFEKVLFWPQGSQDLRYLESLEIEDPLEVIDPTVSAYDLALQNRGYVGTRLHGGIRALQLGLPALILSVDQRATTISSDTGLQVIPRVADIEASIDEVLNASRNQTLTIPAQSRDVWLSQMRDLIV